MKISDMLWLLFGVVALALGVVEILQGKYLMALSALVIGGILIGTAVPSLLKGLTFRGFRPR